MSRLNSRRSADGRMVAYGAPLALWRVEWAYDLDAVKFGLETGLDFTGEYGYIKVHFGPFQFALIVVWGVEKNKTDKLA